MKIQWLGHSCFRLTESTGTSIIADPYSPETGLMLPSLRADAVTLSHSHSDHNFVKAFKGKPEIISTLGAFEVSGIHISSVASFHDSVGGRARGENLIFKYRIDGVEVCHLGDVGEECNPLMCEAIGSVNVLMVPVGGKFTINAEQAKEYIDKLVPEIVIPMHFKTRDTKYDIAGRDEFISLFDEENIDYVHGDTIELDRTRFDGDFSTKVIVFDKY